MSKMLRRRVILLIFTSFGLLVCGARAHATEIPSTITSTLIIYSDSELTGDVTCAVALTMPGANPCISFGADHLELRLNGHTITGPVTPPTGCSLPTDSKYGVGIAVLGRSDVKIEGPGIIQYFERWGILLSSSSQVTLKKVTADHNCWSGMQVTNTSDSTFEENVLTNDAAGSNGASCGGT
ncbi:MAG TPA: right-handed parallel beta-helix repeat-containing protein [Candidatus Dormibacteraeota bacterium]|nr:right-handed parallel beta-helix repeat-containing protein [Candidatus Dormibacteraeota bacterium]